MRQDEIYLSRIKDGPEKYLQALQEIEYHSKINVDNSIYKRIAENFNSNGSLTLYFMGTLGMDSENDGIYKDMFFNLQKSVNNKYGLENYKESDKFYNSKNELIGDYHTNFNWDSDIVNSAAKQMKKISFELNGNLYETEFEQITDMVNYDMVIEVLLNGALENEGYKEKWFSLPSIDQTYIMIFTSKEFYEKINNEGYIGTQEYYNTLPL